MNVFHSQLPCPQVHLPSGARVIFEAHHAAVDDTVAGELREHLDDPALHALAITEKSPLPAPPAAAGGAPDAVSGEPGSLEPAAPAPPAARKPASRAKRS